MPSDFVADIHSIPSAPAAAPPVAPLPPLWSLLFIGTVSASLWWLIFRLIAALHGFAE